MCHISAHAGGAGYAGAGTSSAGIGVGHRLSRRPSPGIIAAFTWHIAPARREERLAPLGEPGAATASLTASSHALT